MACVNIDSDQEVDRQSPLLGVQKAGLSPSYTKRMALEAYEFAFRGRRCDAMADIGAGKGELSTMVAPLTTRLVMLDLHPPTDLPAGAEFVAVDLNFSWNVASGTIDFAFALECIEHVENPRHFMKEIARILRPGGYGFVSTPNNHSLASKLTFLLKGEHRLFQDASYPAHITPLLRCDLLRILRENQLRPIRWFYSNEDVIPKMGWRIRLPGPLFSLSHGVLFTRP
jgi:2-polyprenyl-3-methyl-5-hydroxy-6-metoxy-1,4-benzoquinol methylase